MSINKDGTTTDLLAQPEFMSWRAFGILCHLQNCPGRTDKISEMAWSSDFETVQDIKEAVDQLVEAGIALTDGEKVRMIKGAVLGRSR